MDKLAKPAALPEGHAAAEEHSRRSDEWHALWFQYFAMCFDNVFSQLDTLFQGEAIMSQELDALTAQVTANTSVEESAVTLIQGIAAQLAAAIAAGNPAALTALQASLNASATDLAAAIAANTTAAPAAAKRK